MCSDRARQRPRTSAKEDSTTLIPYFHSDECDVTGSEALQSINYTLINFTPRSDGASAVKIICFERGSKGLILTAGLLVIDFLTYGKLSQSWHALSRPSDRSLMLSSVTTVFSSHRPA
ncbi:hypothetical protein EVAR_36761_1 [Eumeta japonica]|uniref:Uncharacterized protein n=1 Tax=Eumeta variegata TaxID=151549 RepID=A0A4C1X1Q7_EUMVA|nr:hypothetical protein EVAR_36761_1 [Eumeta japonica]